MQLVRSVKLHFKEGSSDKDYYARLYRDGDTYAVAGANCRRGGTPIEQKPVIEGASLTDAEAAFTKLVASKTKKGYQIEDSDGAYDALPVNKAASGIRLQLLAPIDETEVARLLVHPQYGLMEKYDGDRRAIQADHEPRGINKLGHVVPVTSALANAIAKLPFGTIIDGELVGDVYYAFDLLAHGQNNVCEEDFQKRHTLLAELAANSDIVSDRFQVAPLFKGDDKTAAFQRLRDAGKEGIVLKHLEGTYAAGRDTTTLTATKYKWYSTATIRIAGKTPGKHSAQMEMFRNGEPVPVGSVTIAPSMEIPPVGSYAEVRYLYVLAAGGALYQPTFLRLRDDVNDDDCDVSQLKYKTTAA